MQRSTTLVDSYALMCYVRNKQEVQEREVSYVMKIGHRGVFDCSKGNTVKAEAPFGL